MKPIVLYDANIFNLMPIEDIKIFLDGSDNYITDDIAKELLNAKKINNKNEEFQDKLDLIFNKKSGLKDNLSLIISHVPIGLGKTYENSVNVLNPKSNPLICSTHHFWLPKIVMPNLITDPLRHMNSELTWRLRNRDVTYKEIENIKNKLRVREIERAKPYFENSNITAKKIIKTWAKRDVDINNGKFKISDSRLIMHILNMMLLKRTNVHLLTGDYDLIDLSNNLMSSIIDQYVINEVLTTYCKRLNLECNKQTTLDIPISLFKEQHEKVLEKMNNSEKYLIYTISFYNNVDGKIYPQEKIIPDWLLSFVLLYKGNMDCFGLDESIYNKYPIQYIWYSDWRDSATTVRFEVWKRDLQKNSNIIEPMKCMFFCKYEGEEINTPDKIGEFILPKEEL